MKTSMLLQIGRMNAAPCYGFRAIPGEWGEACEYLDSAVACGAGSWGDVENIREAFDIAISMARSDGQ